MSALIKNDIFPELTAASFFLGCGGFDWEASKIFPQADILIGCYPYTGFSIGAGRRAKGTASRNLLLGGFKNLGYAPQYKLLKAADYGAPQERKRIFIVGIRHDMVKCFNYEFPRPTHGPGTKKPYITMKDAIHGPDTWPEGEFSADKFHGHYLTRNRKRKWTDPSFTIVAHHAHIPLHPMGKPMVRLREDSWALQGKGNGRLSWKECRILQGLPAALNPGIDLTHKYLVVGNPVPPVFAKALLRPVVEYEKKLLEKR